MYPFNSISVLRSSNCLFYSVFHLSFCLTFYPFFKTVAMALHDLQLMVVYVYLSIYLSTYLFFKTVAMALFILHDFKLMTLFVTNSTLNTTTKNNFIKIYQFHFCRCFHSNIFLKP